MQTVHSFFSEGFFGYGEAGDFQYGSLSHFIPIVLLAAAVFLTARYGKRIAAWKHEGSLRFLLAFVAIIVEMSYFWRLLYVGDPGSDTLLQCLPLAAISAVLNPRIEGANYMYPASDTDSFSMANLFPASIPLRVVIYATVALLLFFLAYLPYYIRDHRKPAVGGKADSAKCLVPIADNTPMA